MSLALAHFAFGAGMTTFVITLLPMDVRFPRTLIAAGGGWALLPDLYQVIPYATERLYEIHQTSPWVDVFWLHRMWDQLNPTDSEWVAAANLGIFIIVTFLAELWDYHAARAIRGAYEPLLDSESGD